MSAAPSGRRRQPPSTGSGRGSPPTTGRASNQAIGAAGEAQAAAWYELQGYEVLDRNWRCREGEIDIVVRKGRTVVFCEVKTRSSLRFGAPIEAITPVKQQRLRVLSARWIESTGARPTNIRFDVACILAGELDVVQGAF